MNGYYKVKISLPVLLLVFIHKSVGSVESQYVGCYNDESAQAMSIRTDDSGNTISKCLHYCQQNNYTFTGLQNRNQCHCGEEFTRYGAAGEEECNSDCPGDNTQKCGGSSKLSIYSTCPTGFYGSNCTTPCPLNCNRICHFITGRCCEESQQPADSFCNFYKSEDCGVLIGDPRSVVGDMSFNSGTWVNLFTTMTFDKNAAIKRINYFTRKAGTEYLSFWRNTKNLKYMMVAKVALTPTEAGVQREDINPKERLHVQAGDATGLYYLNGEKGMIPYQGSTTSEILAEHIHDVIHYPYTGSASWVPGYVQSFFRRTSEGKTPALRIEYDCIQECPPGKFGSNCQEDCGQCKEGTRCHNVEGTCPDGCKPGFQGAWCQECAYNTFGEDCRMCSPNCDILPCDPKTGYCKDLKCALGFLGYNCSVECPHGTFGEKCLSDCFPNCKDNCDHVTGVCTHGCLDGWTGQMCDFVAERKSNTFTVAMGISVTLLIAILVTVLVAFLIKRNKKTKGTLSSENQISSGLKCKSSPKEAIPANKGAKDVFELIHAGQTGANEVLEMDPHDKPSVYEKPERISIEDEKKYTSIKKYA